MLVHKPGHGEKSREACDLVRRQRLDPHHKRDERQKHVLRLHVVLLVHGDEKWVIMLAAVTAAATADPASAAAVAKRNRADRALTDVQEFIAVHARQEVRNTTQLVCGRENLRLPCMLTRKTIREKK